MATSPLLRAAVLLSSVWCLCPASLTGQPAPPSRLVCWRPAPKPSCSLIVLTNFGLYVSAGSSVTTQGDPFQGPIVENSRIVGAGRATGDWGFLANVGRRDAIGLSVLGSVENSGLGNAAELVGYVRYRRWLGPKRNLDLALGMPLILRSGDSFRAPYGLVKYNFNRQLGIALRPEVHRTYVFTDPAHKTSRLFLSLGVETGEKPGFAVSALGGLILGFVALLALQYAD